MTPREKAEAVFVAILLFLLIIGAVVLAALLLHPAKAQEEVIGFNKKDTNIYSFVAAEYTKTTLNVGIGGCLIGPMELIVGDQSLFILSTGQQLPEGCAKK